MEQLMEFLNLHPQTWMTWRGCNYDEWYVWFMVYNSEITFGLYQVFAALGWYGYSNKHARRLHSSFYFVALAIVFHFCGLIHLTDKLSLLYPETRLFSLLQPVLNLAMVLLLVAGVKDVFKWNKLRTADEIAIEQNAVLSSVRAKFSSLNIPLSAKQEINEVIDRHILTTSKKQTDDRLDSDAR